MQRCSSPFSPASSRRKPRKRRLLHRAVARGRRPLAVRVDQRAGDVRRRRPRTALRPARREDTIAGGLTITVRNQSIHPVTQPGTGLGRRTPGLIARRAGARRTRVVRAAGLREPRAGPVVGTRLELRKPSRLVIVGDIRVPRVAGRVEPQGALTRVTFDVAPPTRTPWRRTIAASASIRSRRARCDAAGQPPLPEFVQSIRPRGHQPSRSISVHALRRSRAPIFPATAAARASSST